MSRVDVRFEESPGPGFPPDKKDLAALAENLLVFLGLPDAGVDLAVIGDRRMEELNRAHLGLPGPTNVLSFPDDAGDDDPAFLGSVALSHETLARECFLYGQPPRVHLVRLLAHAFLHLAGLDHGPEMEGLTDAAVARLGNG